METRSSTLLKEAKDALGVRTDADFCRRTGASTAVVRRWRDGSVDAIDSSLKNVHSLCGPLGMTLDQIYVYLKTGDRPKKSEALGNPVVVRAYKEVLAAVDEMGRSLGVPSSSEKGTLIVESSPLSRDMTDTDLLEFIRQKLKSAGYEPTENSLRPFLRDMPTIDQKEAIAALNGQLEVNSHNEAIILPLLALIVREATGDDEIGTRELVAKLRLPTNGDR